jgi:HD-GYP domain-containing protein (c-di-GMP phosphodiesterase class II)
MAIADVFGALTEDRPYHKAMPRDKVLNILKKLAGSEGLDGDIVNALEKNYDAVYDRCFHNRAVYNERQKHLLESIQ